MRATRAAHVTPRRKSVELLRQLLHTSSEPVKATALAGLDEPAWTALLHQADAHRVGPMLRQRLGRDDLRDAVPRTVAVHLTATYLATAAKNQAIDRLLEEALALLAAEGAQAMVLKGAHLAKLIYPDPALRPMSDLDILVRPADIELSVRAFAALGFKSRAGSTQDIDFSDHRHLRPMYRGDGLVVEIHRDFGYPAAAQQDVAQQLRRRAQETRVWGVPALVLGPDDLMLHLCLHMTSYHGFQVELCHVLDLPMLITHYGEAMPWGDFVARCEELGTSRYAYFALAVTERLVGPAMPISVMQALRPQDVDEPMLAAIVEYVLLRPSFTVPDGVRALHDTDGRAGRLASIARSLFPSPERLREIYRLRPGSRAAYAYYFYRPFDILRRRSGFLLGLMLRDDDPIGAVELTGREGAIERMLSGEAGDGILKEALRR